MKNYLLLLILFSSLCCLAQKPNQADSMPVHSYAGRKWLVGTGTAVSYGGAFYFLNKAWYQDYPRSSFHSFNDGAEWLQVDKTGHAWTAYSIGRVTSKLWQWTGVNRNKAALLGSGSGLAYLLSIEYLDGRSTEWGWSWADVGADFFGTALFAGQELGWKEQRIQLKFSTHSTRYRPDMLQQRANELFGSSLPERLLKDYNAQSYWLSTNINSFFPDSHLPSWLNIAVGYGATGMFGGYENLAHDKNGNVIFDRRDIKRYRQWYLAPDIDLSRIKTHSRFLRSMLSVCNVLKFPAPALEFSNNRFRFRAIVF